MNTPLSETMQTHLQAVPLGSALCRTYCEKNATWLEEELPIQLSSNEKLLMEHYAIFPGVDVSYNFFMAEHLSHQHAHMPMVTEVNHCRYGRIGWQMAHNLNLYLGEGDLSLHMKDNCAKSYLSLPLGFYEGISISIDFHKLQQDVPSILKESHLDYEKLQTTFCDKTKITALPNSHHIDCIFHSLYDLPEHLVIPYCKLKIQELILYLSQLSLQNVDLLNSFDTEQVKIIKDIHALLTQHLDHRYTIEELSKKYLLNTSTLKATFKAVYGMPIAAYMKQYRMHQAISLLRETNLSMSEIAALVGYENQSKFTAAFKNVVGVLPTTYRKNLS